MNHLDTFSGIGGWALAARWMGWQTLAFVEKEKFCHKVLNKNFPEVPIYDDIFTFSGKPFRGRVDILTGSTPCQPFSQAGKREGSNDERHLFPEFLRVVAEVEPRWIIIENVYGLLSIESGQVFEDYHASLESQGYSVQTVCIPASALNAPHRRDRLWIVACTNTDIRQARPRNVAKSIGAKFAESCPNSTDATHADCDRTLVQGRNGDSHDSKRNAATEIQEWADIEFGSRTANSDVADTSESRLQAARSAASSEFSAESRGGLHDRPKQQGRDVAAKPISIGRRGRCDGNTTGSRREIQTTGRAARSWQDNWTDVATRTCLRGVDDGLSAELDIIGSRDNRVSRLKSLGNAIVPSIAYELFRAIEEADQ